MWKEQLEERDIATFSDVSIWPVARKVAKQ